MFIINAHILENQRFMDIYEVGEALTYHEAEKRGAIDDWCFEYYDNFEKLAGQESFNFKTADELADFCKNHTVEEADDEFINRMIYDSIREGVSFSKPFARLGSSYTNDREFAERYIEEFANYLGIDILNLDEIKDEDIETIIETTKRFKDVNYDLLNEAIDAVIYHSSFSDFSKNISTIHEEWSDDFSFNEKINDMVESGIHSKEDMKSFFGVFSFLYKEYGEFNNVKMSKMMDIFAEIYTGYKWSSACSQLNQGKPIDFAYREEIAEKLLGEDAVDLFDV